MLACIKSIIKISLITLVFLGHFATIAQAQSNQWILGEWQLSYDPDGDSKDTVIFSPNNVFKNIASNGKQFNGNYEVLNGRVKVSLTEQGKTYMTFFLGFEKNKQNLSFYSEKTQKTSVYKKK